MSCERRRHPSQSRRLAPLATSERPWPHRLVDIDPATLAVNGLADHASVRGAGCGEPHPLLTSRTRDSLQANEMTGREDQRHSLDRVQRGRVVLMKTEVSAIEEARCGNAPK
jgi:hypothetical protein